MPDILDNLPDNDVLSSLPDQTGNETPKTSKTPKLGFFESHQNLRRLLTGEPTDWEKSEYQKLKMPLPVNPTQNSILPEMEHPKDEGWLGWGLRGLYNNLVQPLGSPAGFLGAADTRGIRLKPSAAEAKSAIKPSSDLPGAIPLDKLGIPEEELAQRALWNTADNITPEIPKELTAIDKVKNALSEATSVRGQQNKLYSEALKEKAAKLKAITSTGKQWHIDTSKALAGELPKAEFSPLKLEQTDVEDLFNTIRTAPGLREFERKRAADGLAKLLGEYGGNVPQENEIHLLERVYGKEFASLVRDKLPEIDKLRSAISEAVNLPRAMQASMDLSAPFRQGLGLVHKKQFWTSWDDMFKSFGSQKAFDAVQDSIRMSDHFDLGQEVGLHLSDLTSLSRREEQFMSNWAESGIPLGKVIGKPGEVAQKAYAQTIGRGVRASNRAYVGFLNKLRQDTFTSLVNDAIKSGIKPEENLLLMKELASFVNTATGRGSLGRLEQNAVMLNNIFFSPRMIASRVKMLNPVTYLNPSIPAVVRKEYLKSFLAMASVGSTVGGLLKASGLAEAELNPTSADFGKIKVGNTRFDPFGGFQQYVVAANRLIQGKTTSSTTGATTDLTEGKFGRPTRLDILTRFAENKLSPPVSFAFRMLRGKDYTGQPINVSKETANLFIPMMVQDIMDIAADDPTLLPFAIPAAATGVGVQTYGNQSNQLKELQEVK